MEPPPPPSCASASLPPAEQDKIRGGTALLGAYHCRTSFSCMSVLLGLRLGDLITQSSRYAWQKRAIIRFPVNHPTRASTTAHRLQWSLTHVHLVNLARVPNTLTFAATGMVFCLSAPVAAWISLHGAYRRYTSPHPQPFSAANKSSDTHFFNNIDIAAQTSLMTRSAHLRSRSQ